MEENKEKNAKAMEVGANSYAIMVGLMQRHGVGTAIMKDITTAAQREAEILAESMVAPVVEDPKARQEFIDQVVIHMTPRIATAWSVADELWVERIRRLKGERNREVVAITDRIRDGIKYNKVKDLLIARLIDEVGFSPDKWIEAVERVHPNHP